MTSPASSNRPYQGYPYVRPIVTDAPSVDAETAARWTNLPRRAVIPSHVTLPFPGATGKNSQQDAEKRISDRPVIYIDIPEQNNLSDASSGTRNSPITQAPKSNDTHTQPQQGRPNDVRREIEDLTTVYIDLPEDDGSEENASGSIRNQMIASSKGEEESRSQGTASAKSPEAVSGSSRDEDIAGGSGVGLESASGSTGGQENSGFIEDTIFYDPFGDKRIESPTLPSADSSSSSNIHPPTLSLPSSTDNGESSIQYNTLQNSSTPHLLSKEANWLSTPRQSPNDGFTLPPLPVPEYPEPPPAYTEVDTRTNSPDEPPRTEVIVPDPPANNTNRKLIMCPYCGRRVLTLMVRESGVFTHVLGLICLFSCFPLTICVYCTNCCKYKNHYCPQCNNLIAYEVPILCQNMVYSKV